MRIYATIPLGQKGCELIDHLCISPILAGMTVMKKVLMSNLF